MTDLLGSFGTGLFASVLIYVLWCAVRMLFPKPGKHSPQYKEV